MEATLKQNAPDARPVPENIAVGNTRDIVGRALGVSGATYQRAKHVVETAAPADEGAARSAP